MHIDDTKLQSLTDQILGHIPDGHGYVFMTAETEPEDPEKTDVDYLSNLPPHMAALLIRDTAGVLDGVGGEPEEPVIPYAG